MRIAQIAPLWERVPPPAYGGIELVVGLLSDELVRRGHEVTLFASGDSISRNWNQFTPKPCVSTPLSRNLVSTRCCK
jgi:glycosyltransferase involved in cell wall biosynthesis